MPLIPAQQTVEKETLSLRLDRALHERLKQYAAFLQSPKDYIISQALRRLFDKDHEFAAWLKAPYHHGSAGEAASAGRARDLGVSAVVPRTRSEE